ncbi:MAG: hypothetical protein V5A43_08190 [Haloarculaceae archaeon]
MVLITAAVDPDLNILEMAFDDNLSTTVFQETLLGTLDKHLATMTGPAGGGGESDLW